MPVDTNQLSDHIVQLSFSQIILVLSLAEALLIFNFICSPAQPSLARQQAGSFSMLDLFHLETTGNFQIEKQNKMCGSGLWSCLI